MIARHTGPGLMRANQLFRSELEITLEEAIRAGGRLAVAARHVSDFGDAQIEDPEAENFITVHTSRDGVAWKLATGVPWYRHPWNRGFDLVLKAGALEPGDRVRIELGGAGGFRGQSFVEERFCLRVGLQPDAQAEWIVSEIDESPGWPIVGAGPTAIRIHIPDANAEQPLGSACLKLEDTYGNPTAAETEIALLLDDRRCVRRMTLTEGMAEVSDVPLPADGSWHRLTAVSSDGRFFARSNPFGPSLMPGYRLFWGEIHAQSGLCDGTNSPAYLYRYARQAAGLDFAAVSSHDFEMTPDDWSQVTEATREAHRPGAFVTLLGYEWSGRTERGGDNNVYFLGDAGPLLYNGKCFSPEAWEPAGRYVDKTRTIADVIAELGKQPALVVPHCGGRIANLDFYDARLMPVFEIHSCHRNYEHLAHEAIRRGLKLGFIGGSDDHRGALGDSVPAARERFFSARNGLMAVYARELTRAGLWEAIFARRVYATNGCRIALGFTANGIAMGGELQVNRGDAVCFDFTAVLDGYFDHAELIVQEDQLARFAGDANQILTFTGQHTTYATSGTTAYYVKVFQTDGGIAWSSPIWVTA
jgi:hypothetical protein